MPLHRNESVSQKALSLKLEETFVMKNYIFLKENVTCFTPPCSDPKVALQPEFFLEHCVESVQIRSFFWSLPSCIQSEYRKLPTKKTPYLDTFHTVEAKVPTFSSSILFILFYFSFLTLARKTYH